MTDYREHQFKKPITVYHLRCDRCRHNFYGPEECECPACGSDELKEIGPQQHHKISIYAEDGVVEVD